MIVELKPTSLIATEVPIDADDFEFHYRNYEPYVTYKTGMGTEDFDILRMSIPKGRYEILGEVTKDKIGFDVTPFLRKIIHTNEPVYYKFYNNEGAIATTDEHKSFYSLLAANGLYFENPIGNKKVNVPSNGFSDGDWTLENLVEEWQSFEDKLITGKLLILEKILKLRQWKNKK